MRKGTSFAKKRAILFHRVKNANMTYWCQKYMAKSKRNHNPKFWSVIQRKQT